MFEGMQFGYKLFKVNKNLAQLRFYFLFTNKLLGKKFQK